MYAVIGLALDVVGAVILTFALFRPAQSIGWGGGHSRTPGEAASDAALGCVGAGLLISGFAMQALGPLGITCEPSRSTKLIVGGGTLVGAVVLAFVLHGLLRRAFLGRERREAGERGDQ